MCGQSFNPPKNKINKNSNMDLVRSDNIMSNIISNMESNGVNII